MPLLLTKLQPSRADPDLLVDRSQALRSPWWQRATWSSIEAEVARLRGRSSAAATLFGRASDRWLVEELEGRQGWQQARVAAASAAFEANLVDEAVALLELECFDPKAAEEATLFAKVALLRGLIAMTRGSLDTCAQHLNTARSPKPSATYEEGTSMYEVEPTPSSYWAMWPCSRSIPTKPVPAIARPFASASTAVTTWHAVVRTTSSPISSLPCAATTSPSSAKGGRGSSSLRHRLPIDSPLCRATHIWLASTSVVLARPCTATPCGSASISMNLRRFKLGLLAFQIGPSLRTESD